MLHQENKNLLYIYLSILMVLSCKNEVKINEPINTSTQLVGENVYNHLYRQINDSLNVWKNNNLLEYLNLYPYKVDNILAINKGANKLVTSLLISNTKDTEHTGDGIIFLYGAKIENKWYFFTGAYIVLPREMYQKDLTKPLSFEKLHEIALKEVFSGYLKPKDRPFWEFWKPREYEVNEDFFKQVENKQIDGTYAGCKTFEEKVLFLVKKNWGIYEPCNYKLVTIIDKKNNAYFDFVDSLDFVDLQKKGYVEREGNLLKYYERHCKNSDYLNEH